jgi:UDP-N-acetylmuramoyl-L-alanyl-D-glutamate--2,6-diaminopimelate ligase
LRTPYEQPDAAMFTVGVTGTNGKTSSAVWLGRRCRVRAN